MLTAALFAGSVATVAARVPGGDAHIPAVTRRARSLLEIVWEELPFPTGDAKHLAQTSESAVVDGEEYDTKYQVLLRSGDKVGDNVYGLLVDKDGKGLELEGEPYISSGNDFNSFIAHGTTVTMITHFEAPDPAATYFTKMTQDPATGLLTVDSTEPLDWSAYGGIWVTCAGSVTPWKSHFGSEEYEPDARSLADHVKASPGGTEWLEERYASWVHLYLGIPETATNAEVAEQWFPYNYGYPWEVVVDENGDFVSGVKHMAAGRLAIELPYVMPDQQTVYITDDGTNVILGIYKLTTPGDLTCGTLWAAKADQTESVGGGAFDISWIQVGEEACDDEIRAKVETTSFYDLFDAEEPMEDGTCAEGYTSINAQPGGHECLKLKEGMQKYAARFEFRRLAAMLGATAEFSKWEGITFDTKRNRIYTAMSEIRNGMEDFKGKGEANPEFDVGSSNDVRLEYNPCGCVYYMDVDADYMATNMVALVCGNSNLNTDEFNTCDKSNIAGPDNVAYVLGHDALIIGEDTDEHQNDAMWYYDFKDGSLTRFLTTPYGSETTSPYWYPNINGWAYLTAVVQHPYGESDEDQIDDPKATGVAGYTGYVGPFKAHPDSVNMAEPPTGDYLWNGFPNLGLHGDGAMGGYGDSGDSVVAVGGGDDVEGEPLMSTAEGTSPDVDSGAEAGDPEATSAESR